MPIYEYCCQACGDESEILHKMSDPPATVCPACGKPALTKLVSAAGFRLAGGGWYETDFKSAGKKNLVADAAPAKAAEAAPAKTADAAPAKAAETAPKKTEATAKKAESTPKKAEASVGGRDKPTASKPAPA